MNVIAAHAQDFLADDELLLSILISQNTLSRYKLLDVLDVFSFVFQYCSLSHITKQFINAPPRTAPTPTKLWGVSRVL
jgi:hypothetical protein